MTSSISVLDVKQCNTRGRIQWECPDITITPVRSVKMNSPIKYQMQQNYRDEVRSNWIGGGRWWSPAGHRQLRYHYYTSYYFNYWTRDKISTAVVETVQVATSVRAVWSQRRFVCWVSRDQWGRGFWFYNLLSAASRCLFILFPFFCVYHTLAKPVSFQRFSFLEREHFSRSFRFFRFVHSWLSLFPLWIRRFVYFVITALPRWQPKTIFMGIAARERFYMS